MTIKIMRRPNGQPISIDQAVMESLRYQYDRSGELETLRDGLEKAQGAIGKLVAILASHGLIATEEVNEFVNYEFSVTEE